MRQCVRPAARLDRLGLVRFSQLRRVQIVALDVKNPVPTCPIILECDLRPQLHQLFFRKLFSQTRIQIVRHIGWRICHCVSQLNDQAFSVIEWCPVVGRDSEQFFIA